MTNTPIRTRAGVTKIAISRRCAQEVPEGRREGARRASARRATSSWGRTRDAPTTCCAMSGSALLVRRLLRGLNDVLGGRLAGEQQRDLVVHRPADRRAERRVEVELDERCVVAHLQQVRQRRVGDRAGRGGGGRQAHVLLGEGGLDLFREQVLHEVDRPVGGLLGDRPGVTAAELGGGVTLATLPRGEREPAGLLAQALLVVGEALHDAGLPVTLELGGDLAGREQAGGGGRALLGRRGEEA